MAIRAAGSRGWTMTSSSSSNQASIAVPVDAHAVAQLLDRAVGVAPRRVDGLLAARLDRVVRRRAAARRTGLGAGRDEARRRRRRPAARTTAGSAGPPTRTARRRCRRRPRRRGRRAHGGAPARCGRGLVARSRPPATAGPAAMFPRAVRRLAGGASCSPAHASSASTPDAGRIPAWPERQPAQLVLDPERPARRAEGVVVGEDRALPPGERRPAAGAPRSMPAMRWRSATMRSSGGPAGVGGDGPDPPVAALPTQRAARPAWRAAVRARPSAPGTAARTRRSPTWSLSPSRATMAERYARPRTASRRVADRATGARRGDDGATDL